MNHDVHIWFVLNILVIVISRRFVSMTPFCYGILTRKVDRHDHLSINIDRYSKIVKDRG